jgi:hypothetical protein
MVRDRCNNTMTVEEPTGQHTCMVHNQPQAVLHIALTIVSLTALH